VISGGCQDGGCRWFHPVPFFVSFIAEISMSATSRVESLPPGIPGVTNITVPAGTGATPNERVAIRVPSMCRLLFQITPSQVQAGGAQLMTSRSLDGVNWVDTAATFINAAGIFPINAQTSPFYALRWADGQTGPPVQLVMHQMPALLILTQ
jgi:hypothetical protein